MPRLIILGRQNFLGRAGGLKFGDKVRVGEFDEVV